MIITRWHSLLSGHELDAPSHYKVKGAKYEITVHDIWVSVWGACNFKLDLQRPPLISMIRKSSLRHFLESINHHSSNATIKAEVESAAVCTTAIKIIISQRPLNWKLMVSFPLSPWPLYVSYMTFWPGRLNIDMSSSSTIWLDSWESETWGI